MRWRFISVVSLAACASVHGPVHTPAVTDLLIFPMSPERKTAATLFLEKLQAAVKQGDMVQVATMIRYPLLLKGRSSVDSPAQFIDGAAAILGPKARGDILRQSPNDLVDTSEGIMLDSGAVWLDRDCAPTKPESDCGDSGFRIIAIND
jgi:hypothetical protein